MIRPHPGTPQTAFTIRFVIPPHPPNMEQMSLKLCHAKGYKLSKRVLSLKTTNEKNVPVQ